MNIYHASLLDHYHHPRHKGVLEHPDFVTYLENPSCGDSIKWQGILSQGHIAQIVFTGKGCVISQAVASMLAHQCQGVAVDTIYTWNTETVLTMINMSLGPTRLKCALLPLEALHKGLQDLPCLTVPN